jgi:hypothetical protein
MWIKWCNWRNWWAQWHHDDDLRLGRHRVLSPRIWPKLNRLLTPWLLAGWQGPLCVASHTETLPVIQAVRRAVSFRGVGRDVTNGRVMVRLTLTSFFLHYAHGRPITVGFFSTKLTRLSRRHRFNVSPDGNSIFPDVNDRHCNVQ